MPIVSFGANALGGEISTLFSAAKAQEPELPRMLAEQVEPKTVDEMVGQEMAVARLREWLMRFRRGDKDIPAAALLVGPPGIGKSILARLALKEAGYCPNEFDVSNVHERSSTGGQDRESETRNPRSNRNSTVEETPTRPSYELGAPPAKKSRICGGNQRSKSKVLADNAMYRYLTEIIGCPGAAAIVDDCESLEGGEDRGELYGLISIINRRPPIERAIHRRGRGRPPTKMRRAFISSEEFEALRGQRSVLQCPVICIASDPSDKHVRTLAPYCLEITMSRLDTGAMQVVLDRACRIAQVEMPSEAKDVILESMNGDARALICAVDIMSRLENQKEQDKNHINWIRLFSNHNQRFAAMDAAHNILCGVPKVCTTDGAEGRSSNCVQDYMETSERESVLSLIQNNYISFVAPSPNDTDTAMMSRDWEILSRVANDLSASDVLNRMTWTLRAWDMFAYEEILACGAASRYSRYRLDHRQSDLAQPIPDLVYPPRVHRMTSARRVKLALTSIFHHSYGLQEEQERKGRVWCVRMFLPSSSSAMDIAHAMVHRIRKCVFPKFLTMRHAEQKKVVEEWREMGLVAEDLDRVILLSDPFLTLNEQAELEVRSRTVVEDGVERKRWEHNPARKHKQATLTLCKQMLQTSWREYETQQDEEKARSAQTKVVVQVVAHGASQWRSSNWKMQARVQEDKHTDSNMLPPPAKHFKAEMPPQSVFANIAIPPNSFGIG